MRLLRAMLLSAAIAVLSFMLARELVGALGLPPGDLRTALTGGLFGLLLGALLTLGEYAALDLELLASPLHWGAPTLQGAILGGILGAGAFNLAEHLVQLLHFHPAARMVEWILMGAAIGAIEGLKNTSWRRALSAGIGATLGGLGGALLIELAPRLLLHPNEPWLSNGVATATLACFGALLGLGMALSQVMSREATLTVLDAPLAKQINQAFPVGSIGDQETIGSLKTTWTLTGDSQILPRHAMLSRQGSDIYVHPLEGATVEVGATPLEPEQVPEVHDLAFHLLAGPDERHLLRDGDVLRLGQGTYLYFRYTRLRGAAQGAAATAMLLLGLMALPAAAAPEIRIQGIHPQDFPRLQVDVLLTENGQPVEGLDAHAFRVRADGGRELALEAVLLGADAPEPNYLVLVIDKSGSMVTPAPGAAGANKLMVVKEAAKRFVERVRPQDRVAIVAFDQEVTSSDFTEDRARLVEAIDQIEMRPGYSGTTNLYDGVGAALDRLGQIRAQEPAARLTVVALTDGYHDVEAKHSVASLAALAQAQQATIYMIGFGDHAIARGKIGYIDEPVMRDLARAGHGSYLYAPNLDGLEGAYDRIIRSLRGQYRLQLRDPLPEPDGYTHQLRLEAAQLSVEDSYRWPTAGRLPGTWWSRLVLNLGAIGLLLAAYALTPLVGARLAVAMRPTRVPLPLKQEAMRHWKEPAERIARETRPEPEPEPQVAPTEPRPRKGIRSIRRLED